MRAACADHFGTKYPTRHFLPSDSFQPQQQGRKCVGRTRYAGEVIANLPESTQRNVILIVNIETKQSHGKEK
jgi:hypothetical protein